MKFLSVLQADSSYGGIVADADGATVTFDVKVSNIHSVTLGGNRTLAVTNDITGQEFLVLLTQDGTGSRTATWWSGITWAGGAASNPAAAANSLTMFRFRKTAAGVYTGENVSNPSVVSASPLNNGYLSCSVAGFALTVALKTNAGANPSAGDPVTVAFRNATLATGDQATLSIAAATSLVVSSGSTLGFASATPGRAWVVGFNDAGTFRLGIINCRSGNNVCALRDDTLYSSVAEGGAGGATGSQVIYTGTSVASKAVRILGYLEWSAGLTTAGTWSIVPTRVQPMMRGVSLPGDTVQSARATLGTVATGTTVVLVNNTIPQNTAGDQYLSQSITPTSAANLLEADAQIFATNSAGAGSVMIASLFQDATANALAASWMNVSANGGAFFNKLKTLLLAGTTSPTTIKLRCGCGNAGTTTVNGAGGAQFLGGVMNSYLGLREIMG